MPTRRARVVDLGCGAGNLTVLLARRWPRGADPRRRLEQRDDRRRAGRRGRRVHRRRHRATWAPDEPVDVLLSNAALQWVPGHLDLLPGLVDAVAPGGWLAFQVPGNFEEPSHTIRRELAAEAPYAEHTAGVAAPDAHDAATLPRRPARARLRGRRVGDDLPARAPRRGPGLHLGQRHRRPPDPAGAARRPAPGLRGGVQAPPARGLPRARRRRRTAVPAGVVSWCAPLVGRVASVSNDAAVRDGRWHRRSPIVRRRRVGHGAGSGGSRFGAPGAR